MTREKKSHLENKHQSKNVKVSNVRSTFVKTYDIINEVCKFYENLYSSKDIPDMKLNHILPELIHPLCYQKMMKNIVKTSTQKCSVLSLIHKKGN